MLEHNQGDVVALFAVPGCGGADCDECSRDLLPQLCEKGHHAGIGQDGFYAPYAAVHHGTRALARIPRDGVSPAEAAVATDAVATAYHAVHRRGQVKSTETVFLFGLGGLGFNALQVLLSIGARVLVSDLREDLLQEVVTLGVPTGDVVPAGRAVASFVEACGLAGKIDTVFDFVGSHQTFEDAQHIGKTYYLLGSPSFHDVLLFLDTSACRVVTGPSIRNGPENDPSDTRNHGALLTTLN